MRDGLGDRSSELGVALLVEVLTIDPAHVPAREDLPSQRFIAASHLRFVNHEYGFHLTALPSIELRK